MNNDGMNEWQKIEGAIEPLGATWVEKHKSWNFSVYSMYAEKVVLVFYGENDITNPVYQFEFNPHKNKSGPIWHCRIDETQLNNAIYYGFKVYGPPPTTSLIHNFDPEKILLDPYAKAIYFPPSFNRRAAAEPGSNAGRAPLSVLIKEEKFDWEHDTSIQHGHDTIIYEMHVRGFTKNDNSGIPEDKRGTYAGVIKKIPYLKELGITAVELMPVHQCDPQEGSYWGYMPLNFFSAHQGYAESKDFVGQQNEFRQMVKEFHKAGIEVILDVVYNHTCENGAREPNYCYKGLDNTSYYIMTEDSTNDHYANYTGCGNTIDANNPIASKLIIDSLKHWRGSMHVDGFRFDLASILTRSTDGTINSKRPAIFSKMRMKSFENLRLIAEPWDAVGTYQLGRSFPGWLWMQWNGKYRDTLQQFIKGDSGLISELMTRIYGSVDLFPDDLHYACHPWQSVNYISSHDGSSLYDMVSFEEKNNWANGEENRDGGHEYKWNCGYEGNTNVPESVLKLRKQQVKNFFALLFISNGTPMFRMGDEFLQTQNGNNNPYNQDNATSWLDWSLLEKNRDFFNFAKSIIAFRKAHPTISRSHFWRDDVKWFGTSNGVDYAPYSKSLAFYLDGESQKDNNLYVMINMCDENLTFNIQVQKNWKLVVDTAQDINNFDPNGSTKIEGNQYTVSARSIVILIS